MRVVLSPRSEAHSDCVEAAARLAGDDAVVWLSSFGIRDMGRRLSQAEMDGVRRALVGIPPNLPVGPRPLGEELIGYVCTGRAPRGLERSDEGVEAASRGLLAVAGHANLTWRSPLIGANDETLGPRFPAMALVYEPSSVTRILGASLAFVAEVADDVSPTPFEEAVVARHGFAAVTSELASLVILAAHLGYKVGAALVLLPEERAA